MNLMFRKNFSGEKTLSSSGGGGKARGALGAGRNAKRRDRDRGYSCMEEHHYKTHIFFSAAPKTSSQYNDGAGKQTNDKATVALLVVSVLTYVVRVPYFEILKSGTQCDFVIS